MSSTARLHGEGNPYWKFLHDNREMVTKPLYLMIPLGIHVAYNSKGLRDWKFGAGVASAVVGGCAAILVDKYSCPRTTSTDHVFTPADNEHATMAYEGDIPTLTILTEDPYSAGYVHGQFLAPQICKIRKANDFAIHRIKGVPRETELLSMIETAKECIPSDYIREMEGLVEGYNQKHEELKLSGSPVTLEEIIFLHLLPEMTHLSFPHMEDWASRRKSEMGCTAIFGGNAETGPIFGRNLDWPLAMMGEYPLIIRRKSREGIKTLDLGFPGLIGVLTGMNEYLSLAMNVCTGTTDQIARMPSVLFNRHCLENCSSVDEVKSCQKRPIGPYHLSVVDHEGAMTIHFYQNNGEDYYRSWESEKYLWTTNYRYGEYGRSNPTMTNSREREEVLEEFFSRESEESATERIRKGLNKNQVNNIRTIYSVMMDPKNGKFSYSANTGWGASEKMLEVNTESWFTHDSEV